MQRIDAQGRVQRPSPPLERLRSLQKNSEPPSPGSSPPKSSPKEPERPDRLPVSMPIELIRGRFFIAMREESIREKEGHLDWRRNRARYLRQTRRGSSETSSQRAKIEGSIKLNEDRVDMHRKILPRWRKGLAMALERQKKEEEAFMKTMHVEYEDLIRDVYPEEELRQLHGDFYGPDEAYDSPRPTIRQAGVVAPSREPPESPHSDISNNCFVADLRDDRNLLYRACQAQDEHRAGYEDFRDQHFAGQHPNGFEDWDPNWTREEFDIAHLQEAMKRARILKEREATYREGLRNAQRRGLVPFADQQSMFPKNGTEGYQESQELFEIGLVPRPRIFDWMAAQPETWDGHNQAAAVGDDEFHPPRELEVWDSWSCHEEAHRRERIEVWNPGGRVSWTWNEEVRGRMKELRS